MKIFVLIAVLTVIIFGALVIYARSKKETTTREQYAFKCLAAILSLVTLGVAAISSHEGIPDQILALIGSILGLPKSDPSPAPLSEKVLVALVVGLAIHIIYKSHKNWSGQISGDEIDRSRMRKSTSLVQQALDETTRLALRKPERQCFREMQRYDPVVIPDEPNLVWHDHIRELFELWMPHANFSSTDSLSWNPQKKAWLGKDRSFNRPLYLFCSTEKPSSEAIQDFIHYARITSGTKNLSLYAVFQKSGNSNPISTTQKFQGVNLISEEYLYSNIIDFSDYFTDIITRVENEPFLGTDIVLSDIYTASAVSSDIRGQRIVTNDLGQYLSEWAERAPGKHIALFGEYGQGKSTATLMFVYQSIKGSFSNSSNRIPILLELRGKSPANLSIHELLAAWGQQYKFHASALMKLLIDGRLILILEGFDEMSNVGSTESRIAHFRSLWGFAYPKNKILFTGRRNLFFEDRELNVVFKARNENQLGPLCETLHLRPFSREKIISSLRWVDEQTAREILDSTSNNGQILDIISRPSLLFIVASLWDELSPLFRQGRITSALVIDRFIQHSYIRQQEKERDLNFMVLTTTERRYFNEGIAAYIAARDSTNQIASADLRAAVERLYDAYPTDDHISSEVTIETASIPLKKRFSDRDEAILAVTTDVRTHGILINDAGQRDAFRFAHKSFYELLVAKIHAYTLLNMEPVFYGTIDDAIDGDIKNAERSPETLKFLSEILINNLQLPQDEDLPIRLYDLLFGLRTEKSILRTWLRRLQLLALRILHNRKLIIKFAVLAYLIPLLTFLRTTDLAHQLSEKYPTLNLYHSVPASKNVQYSLTDIVVMLGGMLFFISARFFWNILSQRSQLWAAVLLANDNSTRSNKGEIAIRKFLGKGASESLINKMKKKYNFS